MKNLSTSAFVACCVCLLSAVPAGGQTAAPPAQPAVPAVPAHLLVPSGFTVTVFASDVTNGRLMAVSPDGVLFVARQSKGDVVALPDRDKDGKADSVDVVLGDLTRPHSVAFNGGYLYVATNPAILRVKYANGKVEGAPEKVVDLPVSTTSHWTRTIGFGKDGKLYVSIGSSCNLCEEEDPRRTTIMVYNADGSGGRPFAKGLRNAIGFDWDPGTGVLWASDMSEDGHGEEKPADEINRIEDGKHYGWPYLIDNNEPNPKLTAAKSSLKAAEATPPALALQPHLSPIDLRFYTGDRFPAEYRGAMFVALHGSSATARKDRIGYKVVRVVFKDGKPTGVKTSSPAGSKRGKCWAARPGWLLEPTGPCISPTTTRGSSTGSAINRRNSQSVLLNVTHRSRPDSPYDASAWHSGVSWSPAFCLPSSVRGPPAAGSGVRFVSMKQPLRPRPGILVRFLRGERYQE